MKTHTLFNKAMLAGVAYGIAMMGIPLTSQADDAPLSYKASPDVYRLLNENDQFRVILQTLKPGVRDQWHSHSAFAGYRLTDCTVRVHTPDGKYIDRVLKRGDSFLQQVVQSHSFENIGKTDCDAVVVERK